MIVIFLRIAALRPLPHRRNAPFPASGRAVAARAEPAARGTVVASI